ncbi:MAG: UDP-glucose/GDP-mannose dehydrogenase family protein [Chitinophagaceae bacterium]|nr:UDP-glucose/GDP-mannose dehydrogenase family protein [Chitinophagaceae bacterium]
MKVSIIGTGYVGLVSGVCLASKGHDVICVEMKPDVISLLNSGTPHIYEKGLHELLKEVIQKEKFKVTSDFNSAISFCDLLIIAVGTPSSNGSIDLSQIEEVSRKIGEYIKTSSKYISIVIKSTVLPTTTDTHVSKIIEDISGKPKSCFGLGMNPEFLREGDAIDDFLFPDRIVIGYEDLHTRNLLTELYLDWNCDKIFVNSRTAELIKYANNTILASMISLNNELANLSKVIGNIKYEQIVNGVISDKRWSPFLTNGSRITPQIASYFYPGVGYGGSCFPKDIQAINSFGKKLGLDMGITSSIIDLNNKQVSINLAFLEKEIGDFESKKVLLLGLTFKPGTDDLRESTSLKILDILLQKKMQIFIHDPVAIHRAKEIYLNHNILFLDEAWQQFISQVDIIIIGTNWDQYRVLKKYDEEGVLVGKSIFDSKGLFEVDALINCSYHIVGYSTKSLV